MPIRSPSLSSLLLLLLVAPAALAQPRKPWKNQIKATLLCGVIESGKVITTVPSMDKRKLASPISCAVHLEQNSRASETWSVHLFVEDGDPESHPAHDGSISRTGSAAQDFETQLVPSTDAARQDFWPCRDFAIRAMISNDAGVLWMQDLAVTQTCPKRVEPPANAASLHWTATALKSLPDDAARDAAIAWAAAYERNDDDWFHANFPKAGMTVPGHGKLTWKGVQNAGAQPQDMFAIVPGGACKNEEAHDGCAWGAWETIAKGAGEFWLYNANQSGYGSFPSVVFKKSGKAWAWTAMKLYDTGEP